jgi:hypothetical protein
MAQAIGNHGLRFAAGDGWLAPAVAVAALAGKLCIAEFVVSPVLIEFACFFGVSRIVDSKISLSSAPAAAELEQDLMPATISGM